MDFQRAKRDGTGSRGSPQSDKVTRWHDFTVTVWAVKSSILDHSASHPHAPSPSRTRPRAPSYRSVSLQCPILASPREDLRGWHGPTAWKTSHRMGLDHSGT